MILIILQNEHHVHVFLMGGMCSSCFFFGFETHQVMSKFGESSRAQTTQSGPQVFHLTKVVWLVKTPRNNQEEQILDVVQVIQAMTCLLIPYTWRSRFTTFGRVHVNSPSQKRAPAEFAKGVYYVYL